ncbi:biopolymer transporter ExbD [Dokdonia donghaensis]|uniref:Biopolymer transporter ExbD n=1 Tax=Dokdonia donghaensis DSW-1 TaxID=1300343 RepID=A0A0A2GSZ5_9FLAO|nr:biopolymer transporter ExbD [Dokdonia donghaensis]ANH61787.1 biopolymer transport protein ExbD [Dokdonia donghaensis DSW-1]KGO06369.1 biopolymer transporter ExbD [Dokdonia donghaensis DSW-1]
MSKFRKGGSKELPAVNTASLPDIVFMLLFFFMVATVLRKNDVKVAQILPAADQTEKLQKDRSVYIFGGKPGEGYKQFGTEGKIQIGDKFVNINEVQPAILEEREKLRDELKDRVMVAFKVDKETNSGLVYDVKQELRQANMLKVIYITTQTEDAVTQ